MSLPNHKNLLCEYLNPTFIETGTSKGSALKAAIEAGFERLMSVDTDPCLVANTKARLPQADIVCGDSAAMLPSMIEQAGDRRITFWLDAHSHQISPLRAELDVIRRHRNGKDTILIDDVRLFACCYGFTVCDIVAALKGINADYRMMLLDGYVPGDILAAVPPDMEYVEREDKRRRRMPLRWRTGGGSAPQ